MDTTDKTLIGLIVFLAIVAAIVYFMPIKAANRYAYQTYYYPSTYRSAAYATFPQYGTASSASSSSSSNFTYMPNGYMMTGAAYMPFTTNGYYPPQGNVYYYYTPSGTQPGTYNNY